MAEKTIGATTIAANATMSERMGANAKKQGDKVQFNEASFLLLFVDDVERVNDRLHPGVNAPEGHCEPGYESEAELGIALAAILVICSCRRSTRRGEKCPRPAKDGRQLSRRRQSVRRATPQPS